ncbi:hypothetical protein E0H80_13160 [Acinetobacter sp. ANC 4779]|uniref:hypothetical protein n=1 Tax=Acinetobacter sp. ANC 4779 TaxID=2529848 RepID=UPI00103A61F9|nr:hypothetical protein [Acinetobacter sp. ANC 4779]TCB48926.1 hypothetical protein E0H80_13160 [Acinetobacter sp. ANC 4779]
MLIESVHPEVGAPLNKLQYGHRQKAAQQIELKKLGFSSDPNNVDVDITHVYDYGRKPEGNRLSDWGAKDMSSLWTERAYND